VTVPNDKAKAILDSINYITIATVGDDGQPWNTPVAVFRFSNDYTFYWASWQSNQHSKNIRANGKAFIVIYDSTPAVNNPSSGVYILAAATELTDEQEVMQAALVFKDDPYNPSDGKQYLGDKPRRVYKAVPQRIWMNGDSEIDGNFIDVRVEAESEKTNA
jgi:general stress protein 26